jgi:hypothetical protein
VTADAPSPDVETVAWVMPRQDARDLLSWLRHNRPLGMPDSTFDGLIAALCGAGLPEPSGDKSAVEALADKWDAALDVDSIGTARQFAAELRAAIAEDES